ncbi:hypothetical protein EMPS_01084 [Entomortierella parvispora]|uniref:Uncharacterized protein n=1 Tax=Entomortierella parvispora TaxID=205924 RepID=A0A9P3LS87_9FUNG|nr:hypothetical protein EMPS_01084 [Entomortierella parvispora]
MPVHAFLQPHSARRNPRTMAPPKKQSQAMPSMKELQDLLAQLDAEGGLAIGGGEDAGSANLDDLYDDSYFYSILHDTIKQDTIEISSGNNSNSSDDASTESTKKFDILTLPEECSWGDDHESLGHQMLIRPGYEAVLAALTAASSKPDSSIFMAAGPVGVGKSCLAYFLAYKLFKAGHDVVISDPMFTNAFIDRTYYSCYSPHLDKHTAIHEAVMKAPSTTQTDRCTWWICDDGYLPVKGAKCHMVVNTTSVDRDVDTIRKRKLAATPVQFQIPTWTLDEIKVGLLVSLATATDPASTEKAKTVTKEQDQVLEGLYKKMKANPRKIFGWVKENWVVHEPEAAASTSKEGDIASLISGLNSTKPKSKSKSKSKPKRK